MLMNGLKLFGAPATDFMGTDFLKQVVSFDKNFTQYT